MFISYIKISIAMLLIGSYLVASKIILQYVPVFTAAFTRQCFACIVLIMYVVTTNTPIQIGACRDKLILLWQAFIGVFLYSIFSLYGLQLTSGISANIIMATTPIAVALLGVILLRESITKIKLLCLLVAVVGIIITNYNNGPVVNFTAIAFLGNLLLLLAVMAEAVFITFGRMLSKPLPPIVMSLILTLEGSLLFLPFALVELHTINIKVIPWYVLGLIIYSAVVITAFAVVLMNTVIQIIPTTTAAIFTALIPISGVVLSIVCLKENFYLQHAIGIVLVIIAILPVIIWPNTQRNS